MINHRPRLASNRRTRTLRQARGGLWGTGTGRRSTIIIAMHSARSIRIRGIVQGVGFRPFVYRLARELGLAGWVLNGEDGVAIHAEGPKQALLAFAERLRSDAPPAAVIADIEVHEAAPDGFTDFTIRESERRDRSDRPHLARSSGLRRVPAGTVRPRRPAFSLPVHQLHQLRAALHRHPRASL